MKTAAALHRPPDQQFTYYPASAYYWKVQGNQCARKGDLKEALRCYVTALQIDPQYMDAWHNTRLVLRRIGKIEEADRIAERIATIESRQIVGPCREVISYQQTCRNPYAAAAGSLHFPGLGQMYNMQLSKALVFLVGTVAGLFLFLVPGVIFYVVGAYDAYSTSNLINVSGKSVRKADGATLGVFLVLAFLIVVLTAITMFWVVDTVLGISTTIIPAVSALVIG